MSASAIRTVLRDLDRPATSRRIAEVIYGANPDPAVVRKVSATLRQMENAGMVCKAGRTRNHTGRRAHQYELKREPLRRVRSPNHRGTR